MNRKADLYTALALELASCWQADAVLMESDLATWQRVRIIDDWLFLYRDDDRVGTAQYEKNLKRLRAIYIENERNAA